MHPESYHIAEKLIAIEKFELKDVGSAKFIDHFRRVDPKKFVDSFNNEASFERVPQVLEAFRLKLASDIRDEKARPTFRRDILSVDNLNAGMVLSGEPVQGSLAVSTPLLSRYPTLSRHPTSLRTRALLAPLFFRLPSPLGSLAP